MSRTGCASGRRRPPGGRSAWRPCAWRSQRGLDNVLVEDIAAEAGVSARTFNNYFASKYEAICALAMERGQLIGAELRRRPAGEPLMEAITNAVLAAVRGRRPAARQGLDRGHQARGRVAGAAGGVPADALRRRSGRSRRRSRTGWAPIRDDMFPAVLAGRRDGRHAGRAWSAGCTPTRRSRSCR